MVQCFQCEGSWWYFWWIVGYYVNYSLFDLFSVEVLYDILIWLLLFFYMDIEIDGFCWYFLLIYVDDC